jgi:ribonuclease-3 family protein
MEPLTQAQASQYSPMALAFLGDSVYEVMVREYLLRQANQPAAKLHDQKVQLVCAAFQAAAAERLLPHLTEDEAGVYKRGRNANNTVPRHTSAQDYHRATGLESLFGYLHLTGAGERLEELFEIVMHTGETPAEE